MLRIIEVIDSHFFYCQYKCYIIIFYFHSQQICYAKWKNLNQTSKSDKWFKWFNKIRDFEIIFDFCESTNFFLFFQKNFHFGFDLTGKKIINLVLNSITT